MSLPERKTLRLEGYDYSRAGYYFVTVCTQEKRHLFWDERRGGFGNPPNKPRGGPF